MQSSDICENGYYMSYNTGKYDMSGVFVWNIILFEIYSTLDKGYKSLE